MYAQENTDVVPTGTESAKMGLMNTDIKDNISQPDKKVKGNLLLSEKEEVDYLKAVKLGDMETAQKMVDEAANI